MSRRDLTNTEHDAGIEARAAAYEVDDRERDEPGERAEHTCTSPDPARCLFCALDAAIARQQDEREEQRAWDEYKASQRDEEAS